MSFIRNIKASESSDNQLVESYKTTGDLETLATLYQRYMDLVYGVCLKYLKDHETCKDAVMQIFEELVQKLHKYEIDHFKSWLYTLSKNFCLMRLRKQKHLKIVELDPSLMQSQEEKHLNGVLQKEEDFKRMEKCLQRLSAEQKETVELFYLKQKCYNEISAITGKDWNRIRSLIQNGRRNLKICMEKEE